MGKIRVAEMFAGVGGFRLGLDNGDFDTVWANQWEPGSGSRQFAWRCYESHFGEGSCVNRDIHEVLDDYESGTLDIPDVEMVVGSTPCQDYSIAKPLSMSRGIDGEKGVLWWDFYRMILLKTPRYVLMENVDRLLKSPAKQRGRDFAIMLSCLNGLGYHVEWRVVNSAEYGFPQRRKRVYMFATTDRRMYGVMGSAFPIGDVLTSEEFDIPDDPYVATNEFNADGVKSLFLESGSADGFHVTTSKVIPAYDGRLMTLGDVLVPESEVPDDYWIPDDQLDRWIYLKGSKREPRVAKNGHEYMYSEGKMAFPDPIGRPSRTILTGEGGRSASRFKHVVRQGDRLRRLVPDELDQLQTFPKGWTDTGMTENQRSFCMGNALVVGVVRRIADEMSRRLR